MGFSSGKVGSEEGNYSSSYTDLQKDAEKTSQQEKLAKQKSDTKEWKKAKKAERQTGEKNTLKGGGRRLVKEQQEQKINETVYVGTMPPTALPPEYSNRTDIKVGQAHVQIDHEPKPDSGSVNIRGNKGNKVNYDYDPVQTVHDKGESTVTDADRGRFEKIKKLYKEHPTKYATDGKTVWLILDVAFDDVRGLLGVKPEDLTNLYESVAFRDFQRGITEKFHTQTQTVDGVEVPVSPLTDDEMKDLFSFIVVGRPSADSPFGEYLLQKGDVERFQAIVAKCSPMAESILSRAFTIDPTDDKFGTSTIWGSESFAVSLTALFEEPGEIMARINNLELEVTKVQADRTIKTNKWVEVTAPKRKVTVSYTSSSLVKQAESQQEWLAFNKFEVAKQYVTDLAQGAPDVQEPEDLINKLKDGHFTYTRQMADGEELKPGDKVTYERYDPLTTGRYVVTDNDTHEVVSHFDYVRETDAEGVTHKTVKGLSINMLGMDVKIPDEMSWTTGGSDKTYRIGHLTATLNGPGTPITMSVSNAAGVNDPHLVGGSFDNLRIECGRVSLDVDPFAAHYLKDQDGRDAYALFKTVMHGETELSDFVDRFDVKGEGLTLNYGRVDQSHVTVKLGGGALATIADSRTGRIQTVERTGQGSYRVFDNQGGEGTWQFGKSYVRATVDGKDLSGGEFLQYVLNDTEYFASERPQGGLPGYKQVDIYGKVGGVLGFRVGGNVGITKEELTQLGKDMDARGDELDHLFQTALANLKDPGMDKEEVLKKFWNDFSSIAGDTFKEAKNKGYIKDGHAELILDTRGIADQFFGISGEYVKFDKVLEGLANTTRGGLKVSADMFEGEGSFKDKFMQGNFGMSFDKFVDDYKSRAARMAIGIAYTQSTVFDKMLETYGRRNEDGDGGGVVFAYDDQKDFLKAAMTFTKVGNIKPFGFVSVHVDPKTHEATVFVPLTKTAQDVLSIGGATKQRVHAEFGGGLMMTLPAKDLPKFLKQVTVGLGLSGQVVSHNSVAAVVADPSKGEYITLGTEEDIQRFFTSVSKNKETAPEDFQGAMDEIGKVRIIPGASFAVHVLGDFGNIEALKNFEWQAQATVMGEPGLTLKSGFTIPPVLAGRINLGLNYNLRGGTKVGLSFERNGILGEPGAGKSTFVNVAASVPVDTITKGVKTGINKLKGG